MGWEDAMYVLSKLKKQIGDGITSINNNVNNKVADLKTHVTTTVNKTMNDVIEDVLVPALPDNRDPLTFSNLQWVRPTYSYDFPTISTWRFYFDREPVYGHWGSGYSIRVYLEGPPTFKQTPVTVKGKGKVLFNEMAYQLYWPESMDAIAENKARRYSILIDNVFEFVTNADIVYIPGMVSGVGVYFKDFWKFDFSKSVVCQDGYPYSSIQGLYPSFPLYDNDENYIWRAYSNVHTSASSTPTDINNPFWNTYKQQAVDRYMEKVNTYIKYSNGEYRYKIPESKTRYLIYLA